MRPEPLILPVRRRRLPIRLTPLIDVVFILLLFFMLASNLQREQALRLQLPASEAASALSDEEALLIRLEADGRLRLNGAPVSAADLPGTVGRALGRDPDRAVLLAPAPEASLQQLVSVLDQLASGGIPGVRLQ